MKRNICPAPASRLQRTEVYSLSFLCGSSPVGYLSKKSSLWISTAEWDEVCIRLQIPFYTSTCPQKCPHASWAEKGLPGQGGSAQRGQRSVLWSACITQCSTALLCQSHSLCLFCGGAEWGSISTVLVRNKCHQPAGPSPPTAGTLLHLHQCLPPWRPWTLSLVLSKEGTEAQVPLG